MPYIYMLIHLRKSRIMLYIVQQPELALLTFPEDSSTGTRLSLIRGCVYVTVYGEQPLLLQRLNHAEVK